MELTRRQFAMLGIGGVTGALATNAIAQNQKPPAIAKETVREFVGAGHSDLAKVKEMLAAEPGLLNASWDWGGGDFESALEGAGHMGNREIALFLIGKGARMSIFQAAMLGELDMVKSIIKLHPEAATSKGPHNITLLRHAEKGGEPAAAVLEYLKSLP
jgi:hypothetical protein